MYEDIGELILLSIPFLSAAVLCLILCYGYHKDRDKRKLLFAIGMASAAAGYYSWMTRILTGTSVMGEAYLWTFFPITAAIPIVALSSLFKLKSYGTPFKVFLLALGTSMILLAAQLPLDQLRIILMAVLVSIAYPVMVYVIIKTKEISDLVFLLALACFTAEGITRDIPTTNEITALLTLFGMIFTGLMFVVPTGSRDSMTSFFKLRNQLKHTEKELRLAEEKLRKAERLATIGELADIVGHDLRVPLTGISNAAFYLRIRSDSIMNDKERKMLETIEKCVERSNNIIKELLEYSKEIKLSLAETNPKALIEDALSQILVPDSVEIDVQTQVQPVLKIDKEKMVRVFVNIITNAFDAMPNGGRLIIKSEGTENNVVFSFKDTGSGMTAEVLSKLWTPLFTTKKKGTGFGLSICQRMIEAHGGNITVKSEAGKGALFIVKFPLDATPVN